MVGIQHLTSIAMPFSLLSWVCFLKYRSKPWGIYLVCECLVDQLRTEHQNFVGFCADVLSNVLLVNFGFSVISLSWVTKLALFSNNILTQLLCPILQECGTDHLSQFLAGNEIEILKQTVAPESNA